MADHIVSSNPAARKRHKPIEPPSPEPRRHHPPSATTEEHFYHGHRQQHQIPSNTRDRVLGTRRYHQEPHRVELDRVEEEMHHKDGSGLLLNQGQHRKVKASVFERLGGNVVSPPKRTNPCLNWINTGICPRGQQCIYSHPPLSPEKSSISKLSMRQHHRPSSRDRQPPQTRPAYQQQSETPLYVHHQPHHQPHRHHHRHPPIPSGDSEEFVERASSSKDVHSMNSHSNADAPNHAYEEAFKRDQKRREDSVLQRGVYGHSSRAAVVNYEQKHHKTSAVATAYPASAGIGDDLVSSDCKKTTLRSKVVVTQSGTTTSREAGRETRSKADKAAYIPTTEQAPGDIHDLDSEEALKRQLELLKRQLKELDEGEHIDDEMVVDDTNNQDKVTKFQSSSVELASKREPHRNGSVSAKRPRYQTKEHHVGSPGSSSVTSASAGRYNAARKRLDHIEEPWSMDEDRKPYYHHDDISIRSHGSSSKRVESPLPPRATKHINGERLAHPLENWRTGSRRRSPSAETSVSRRSRHSDDLQRAMTRHHHGGASFSPYPVVETNFPRHQPIGTSRLHRPGRYEFGQIAGVQDDEVVGRRATGSLAEGWSRASRLMPQHHEQHRRLPDRFYERSDDRGNHSKTRTSENRLLNEHVRPIHRSAAAIARDGASSISSHRLRHTRGGARPAEAGAPIGAGGSIHGLAMGRASNRRTTNIPRTKYSSTGQSRRREPTSGVIKKDPLNERRKRPALDARGGDGTRRGGGTANKKARYEGSETRRKQKEHGESSTGKNSGSRSEGKERNTENEKKEAIDRPTEERAILEQRGDLEPISDEEDEDISAGSSIAAAATEGVGAQDEQAASTSRVGENKKMLDALSVEWTEVMRENGGAKSSVSDGRRCFDMNYFWPTIGICSEYADEDVVKGAGEASTAGMSRLGTVAGKYGTMRRSGTRGDTTGRRFRCAVSARADLKMRRQCCGLAAEADIVSNAMELNVPTNAHVFRKSLGLFDAWTCGERDEREHDQQQRQSRVEERNECLSSSS